MEYLLCFVGILLTVVPIFREIKKQRNQGEKFPYLYIGFIVSFGLILICCGWKKIFDDNREKIAFQNKITEMSGNTTRLSHDFNILKDTFNKNVQADRDFKKLLLQKYSIEDSSNIPVKSIQIFNTKIERAKTVNIGNNH